MQNSLNQIQPLLVKKIPNHLEELRLENCKISTDITMQLLEVLNQRCYISKLSLVNINMND